jgi:hypothetical protein
MKRHHQRTLEALFAHPLQHAIRVSKVEALLRVLGAEVDERPDHRLHIRMPGGQETMLHTGGGPHHPDLDGDAVLRLRQFLRDAGVNPEHPIADGPSPRGDQSHRLVLVLNHRHTDVYRLEGEEVEHAVLRPHGLWGTDQNLSHRHERDQAGQKAPVDNDYLTRITAAMAEADAVLLLGHGHGASDLRQVLLRHLERHRRDLLAHIVGIETVDESALSEAGLLSVARAHFGNLPHRHPVQTPGQALQTG